MKKSIKEQRHQNTATEKTAPGRKKTYPGKKNINYIPKTRGAEHNIEQDFFPEIARPEQQVMISTAISAKQPSGIPREKLLALFEKQKDCGIINEKIKEYKEIYLVESVLPEAFKEFKLSMINSIMLPRKQKPYKPPNYERHQEANRDYSAFQERRQEDEAPEEDEGIIAGSDNPMGIPQWYDTKKGLPDTIDGGAEFSMESMMAKQTALEEEKEKFIRGDPKITPQIESLFADIDSGKGFSSIDEKYEATELNKKVILH